MASTAKMLQILHFNRINYGDPTKHGIQLHGSGQASRFTERPVQDQAQKIFDAKQQQSIDFPKPLKNVSLSDREEAEQIQRIAEDAMSCEYFMGTINK